MLGVIDYGVIRRPVHDRFRNPAGAGTVKRCAADSKLPDSLKLERSEFIPNLFSAFRKQVNVTNPMF